MKAKSKKPYYMSIGELSRFFNRADKKHFGGWLRVRVRGLGFKKLQNCHGQTEPRQLVCGHIRDGNNLTPIWDERYYIVINENIRGYYDLCLMTLYHEMVHAELMALGYSYKEARCLKSSKLFNDRMKQLAKDGAFDGLW